MTALFKRFNSKAFLLLYLVVFGCLLLVWQFRFEHQQPDERDIPAELQALVVSPPMPLPQFLLHATEKSGVLTEQSLLGKWSFIYFTHPACLPQCEPVLTVMHNLQQYFASRDLQFLLINFDSDQQRSMASVLRFVKLDFPTFSADQKMTDSLSKAFDFLYLRTRHDDATYSLEQQHTIFLIDPKGRVYARFEPPFTSRAIQEGFFSLRAFYARTE